MTRMPFLLVLRFSFWRRRVLHVVVTVSRTWEQPAGPLSPGRPPPEYKRFAPRDLP